MRWWKELLAPSLKCGRLGHLLLTRRLKGYARPYKVPDAVGFGVVAYGISADIPVCSRCHWQDKTKVEVIGTPRGIHSLGLPSNKWDVLEDTGYFLE